MRDKQLATSLANLPCVTIGGIISTKRAYSLSTLSDVLEAGDHLARYFLSPKACAGILRRAAKRGKELPPQLRRALEAVAGLEQTPSAMAR